MIAKLVHYSGRVQGVGFRYATLSVAQGHRVTGYVRNLADGRVEVWAEGETASVEQFLEAVGRRMAAYIVDCRVQDEAVRGMSDFTIR